MTVLNFIFAVTGWIWLAVVGFAALVICARRKMSEPRRKQAAGEAN
jgi:hypothetical protein